MKKWNQGKVIKRFISILAALALVLTLVPAAVLAGDAPAPQQERTAAGAQVQETAGDEGQAAPPSDGIIQPAKETKPVTAAAFDELETAAYEISAGEGLPVLPDTLKATDADGEALTITGVTWECEAFDANAAGEYIFTAKLPEGYALAKGLSAPSVVVRLTPGAAAASMKKTTGNAMEAREGGGSAFDGGNGTEEDPWRIADETQLAAMAGYLDNPDVYFKLVDDIVLSGEWSPIGTAERPFRGTLDGGKRTVSGLYIACPADNDIGFFGVLEGTAKNLTIVLDQAKGGIRGADNTGGIAGSLLSGSILRCNVQKNAKSAIQIEGKNNTGGLAGYAECGLIQESSCEVSVKGVARTGGLIGYNKGTAEKQSVIENCYSEGWVESTGGPAGGILGYQEYSSLSYCYNKDGDTFNGVIKGNPSGGIAGNKDPNSVITAGVFICSTTNRADGLQPLFPFVLGTQQGWEQAGKWVFGETWVFVGSRPVLKYNSADVNPDFGGGEGTENSPFEIRSAEHLSNLRKYLGSENSDLHFVLARSIALDSYLESGDGNAQWGGKGWLPIGDADNPFCGDLDGNGKTIDGLWIARPQEDGVGLFGALGAGAKLYNFKVEAWGEVSGGDRTGILAGGMDGAALSDITIAARDDAGVNGKDFVGAIAGEAANTNIKNLSVEIGVTGTGTTGGVVGKATAVTAKDITVSGEVKGGAGSGGLFGSIENSSVENGSCSAPVTGAQETGGIAGLAKNTSFTACSAVRRVDGGDKTGGLVGSATGGTVAGCSAEGTVSGENNTGGLVGYSDGNVTRSFASGGVKGKQNTGGLLGVNAGEVDNSFATGETQGTAGVGGLAGLQHADGSVEKSYAANPVDGQDNTGLLIGINDAADGIDAAFYNPYLDTELRGVASGSQEGLIGKTSFQLKDRKTFTTDLGGKAWDFDAVWSIEQGKYYPSMTYSPQDFPQSFAGGEGTQEEPYLIETPEHFNNLRYYMGPAYKDVYYRLENDIDLSDYLETGEGFLMWGEEGWLPIGQSPQSFEDPQDTMFEGHLDGNGATISGLYMDRPLREYAGLFGAAKASVKNLSVVLDERGVTAKKFVGGLAGAAYGEIANCHAYGTVRSVTEETNGSMAGILFGYVGENSKISRCSAQGSVYGKSSFVGMLAGLTVSCDISECYAAGSAEGEADGVGGLVGMLSTATQIRNCYAQAAVSGDYEVGGFAGTAWNDVVVENCYAAGMVAGGQDRRGGFVERAFVADKEDETAQGNDAEIRNCFYDATRYGASMTRAQNSLPYGKSTEEMMRRATFQDAGWDFADVWGIDEGSSYPFLRTGAPVVSVVPQPGGSKVYDGTTDLVFADGEAYKVNGSYDPDGAPLRGSLRLSGKDAGTRMIVLGTLAGPYQIFLANESYEVTPRELSLSGIAAAEKTYDGKTDAKLAETGRLENVLAGERVGFNIKGAEFRDADAGTGKPVDVNVALTGRRSVLQNYVLLKSEITGNILKADPTIVLEPIPAEQVNRNDVVMRVAVTGISGGKTPTGQVRYFDGQALIGQSMVLEGLAEWKPGALAEGSHSLTARYEGDNNYNAGNAGTAAINVPAAVRVTPETPSASPGAPKLGDQSDVNAWIILCVIMGACIAGTVVLKKHWARIRKS